MQFDELEKMKAYCMNTFLCRRFLILQYFDGSEDAEKQCKIMKPQNCCDVCYMKYGGFVGTAEKQLSHLFVGEIADENVVEAQLSEEQKSDIRHQLSQYRDGLAKCVETSLFGVDKVTGFTEAVIEQIIRNCSTFSSVQNVLNTADLWCEDHAIAVFDIVTSVRNDTVNNY